MDIHLTQYNPDELVAHLFLKRDNKEYCEVRLKKTNNMVIVYHGQIFEFYSQMPGTFIANTQTYKTLEEARELMDSIVNKLLDEGYEPFPEGIEMLQKAISKSIAGNVEIQNLIKSEIKKSIHRLGDLATKGTKKLHKEEGVAQSQSRSSLINIIKSEESQYQSQSWQDVKSKRTKQEYKVEEESSEKDTSYAESESLRVASPFRNVVISEYEEEEKQQSVLGRIHNTSIKHFMLPFKWQNQDFVDWYICCKSGGVRCYWNGTKLLSKTLKAYSVPEQFTKDFPKAFLDVELFMQSGSSDDVSEILRKNKCEIKDWKKLHVSVLDAPGLELPFSERLLKMKQVFEDIDSPYISLCEYKICKNRDSLMKKLETVKMKEESTSLILLDPDNMYEEGKSNTMFEIVVTQQEGAEVVGYEKGRSNNGKITKLEVINAHGVKFSIGLGLTDKIKKNPPEIGSIVKFSFQGINKSGVPKKAKLEIIL